MTNWRMEDFAALVPDSLKDCSGKVFYSGRKAFEAPSLVYILGINPGGAPPDHAEEKVGTHTKMVLACEQRDWSAYKDEKWGSYKPGLAPVQRRVKHFCRQAELDLRGVPASNVIFKRSRNLSDLKRDDIKRMVEECWPFHRKVIDTLGVRIVVCLGKAAGRYVREKLKADRKLEKFVEDNNRHWRSCTHQSPDGLQVVTLTHPSRANWTNSKTDPTYLVARAVRRLDQ